MTSHVSQVSKSSLVKGFVYIQGNLTTHVRAREARLWADAEAILCLLELVGVRFDISAYERALARERERERKRRATAQGRFESAALSLDAMPDLDTDECESWLTDGGCGAAAIRGETPEPEDAGDTRRKRLDRAKHRIMRKAPECLRTFWLVIRNGRNRKESIWQMTKTTTSRRRKSGTRRNIAIGTT